MNDRLAQRVFAALADGGLHSGEALAVGAGVTRSAVWKAIEALRADGLAIEATTNRGYRLAAPCEALDAAALRAALTPGAAARLRRLEVAWETGSTNADLLAAPPPPVGSWDALLAENQRGGRGRRGRVWRAALGDSLCLSLATAFEPLPRDLSAATLVVGVCVLRALRAHGADRLALKWPNDLVAVAADGTLAKVGGILVELRAEAGGPAQVIVGVGLNLRAPPGLATTLAAQDGGALPPAGLDRLGVAVGARNAIAAAVMSQCVEGLERFAVAGFAPFREPWLAADALRDRPVRAQGGTATLEGVARGIDGGGALLLEDAAGLRHALVAGEVSVR
jgi:BirA family biotin operon repressor/biotin-[acetyl-CoA-carboxylase] ligase